MSKAWSLTCCRVRSALLRERRIAAILIEICPVNLRSVGLSPADLYREFEAVRYSPYVLNDDGNTGCEDFRSAKLRRCLGQRRFAPSMRRWLLRE